MKNRNQSASPEALKQAVPESTGKEPLPNPVHPVHLNELLGHVLRRIAQTVHTQLILRMDPLPVMNAHPALLEAAFHKLLSTLVLHPPTSGRLFLHIKCEHTGLRTFDTASNQSFIPYHISLHTNACAGPEWMRQHEAQLAEIKRQFACNQITLNCTPDNSSGCLFSLTLPGNPE